MEPSVQRSRILEAVVPPERMPLAPPPLTLPDPAEVLRFLRGGMLAPPREAPDSGLVRVLAGEGLASTLKVDGKTVSYNGEKDRITVE